MAVLVDLFLHGLEKTGDISVHAGLEGLQAVALARGRRCARAVYMGVNIHINDVIHMHESARDGYSFFVHSYFFWQSCSDHLQ